MMFQRIANRLIARAKKTPYFHLPGYMDRYWLVPYKPGRGDSETKNGTYTATWRQPFTWLCQKFDIAIRVHEILRSDTGTPAANGRHLDDGAEAMFHDHPWPYISVILKGGYFEVTPEFKDGMYVGEKRKWYGPGSIIFRRAESWHRLELPVHPAFDIYNGVRRRKEFEQPCTTLFITFKFRQKWGYLVQPFFKRYYRDVHAEAAAKLPEIR